MYDRLRNDLSCDLCDAIRLYRNTFKGKLTTRSFVDESLVLATTTLFCLLHRLLMNHYGCLTIPLIKPDTGSSINFGDSLVEPTIEFIDLYVNL